MLFDDLAVLVEVIRMRKHNEAWLSDDERTSAQEFSNARRQLASTQDIWKEQVGLPEFSHTPASAVLTSLWSYNDTPTSTASGELERSIAGTLNIADNTVFRKNIYIFFKFLTFKKRKKKHSKMVVLKTDFSHCPLKKRPLSVCYDATGKQEMFIL